MADWGAGLIILQFYGGVGVKQSSPAQRPHSFALLLNYPNPFNPITEIKYALPRDCWVRLEIYNILGQKVVALVDGEEKAGYKAVKWDASSLSRGQMIRTKDRAQVTSHKSQDSKHRAQGTSGRTELDRGEIRKTKGGN